MHMCSTFVTLCIHSDWSRGAVEPWLTDIALTRKQMASSPASTQEVSVSDKHKLFLQFSNIACLLSVLAIVVGCQRFCMLEKRKMKGKEQWKLTNTV